MILNLPYHASPENAGKIAAFIVDNIKENYGMVLDYQPESLAHIDELIENFRKTHLPLEDVGSDLFCIGCYVGEVFLRSEGGAWKNTADTAVNTISGIPLVIEMPNGSIGNPIGKTYKCFANGSEDSLTFFYQAYAKRYGKNSA